MLQKAPVLNTNKYGQNGCSGMAKYERLDDAIGNTPMVRLTHLSPEGSSVYVKLEGKNPGGSIKDRAALYMINDAEEKGLLPPGGTIIEPTSGNTGIGAAMIAAARGYRTVLVMPDTMSKERRAYMSAYGAEFVLTPGAEGMKGAVDKAEEIHRNTPGSIILGQFDNPANILAHRYGTGKEILADLPGVDAVTAGFGTGGTASGIAWAFRDAGSEAKVIAIEPAESQMVIKGTAGPHAIQGIGANFIPGNLDRDVVKDFVAVKGQDALDMARRLAHEEGLFLGISSAANVVAAIDYAKSHPGSKVVAISPDGGDKYVSSGIYD